MRTKKTMAVLLLVMVAAVGWKAEPWRSGADEAEIRAVVEKYFEGMMTGSPETLAEAFDPDAFLIGPGRGVPVRIAFDRWSSGMDEPLDDLDQRVNRIASVDVTGDAAVAKTVLEWPEVRYVDYLSLLKIDGEWRIVNKIWHQEAPEALLATIDEVPLATADLERYVGTYRAGETELEVWVEDGRLGMSRRGGVPSPLLHVGDGTFVSALDLDNRVVFQTAGERVSGFELEYGGGEVVAQRIE